MSTRPRSSTSAHKHAGNHKHASPSHYVCWESIMDSLIPNECLVSSQTNANDPTIVYSAGFYYLTAPRVHTTAFLIMFVPSWDFGRVIHQRTHTHTHTHDYYTPHIYFYWARHSLCWLHNSLNVTPDEWLCKRAIIRTSCIFTRPRLIYLIAKVRRRSQHSYERNNQKTQTQTCPANKPTKGFKGIASWHCGQLRVCGVQQLRKHTHTHTTHTLQHIWFRQH